MSDVATIIVVGVPTYTGLIYDEATCKLIVDQFEKIKAWNDSNGVPGKVGHDGTEFTHVVESCWLQDGKIQAVVRFMETRLGIMARSAMRSGTLYLAPRGEGKYHEGTTSVNHQGYKFERFDLNVSPELATKIV